MNATSTPRPSAAREGGGDGGPEPTTAVRRDRPDTDDLRYAVERCEPPGAHRRAVHPGGVAHRHVRLQVATLGAHLGRAMLGGGRSQLGQPGRSRAGAGLGEPHVRGRQHRGQVVPGPYGADLRGHRRRRDRCGERQQWVLRQGQPGVASGRPKGRREVVHPLEGLRHRELAHPPAYRRHIGRRNLARPRSGPAVERPRCRDVDEERQRPERLRPCAPGAGQRVVVPLDALQQVGHRRHPSDLTGWRI